MHEAFLEQEVQERKRAAIAADGPARSRMVHSRLDERSYRMNGSRMKLF
jgi:hypothetical protein